MRLFKIFSGASVEKLEKRGDGLAVAGKWGRAKLAYEHALIQAEKGSGSEGDACDRLRAKTTGAKEALAREHLEQIDLLLEGDNFDEAEDLAGIALELSVDPALRAELETRRQRIAKGRSLRIETEAPDPLYGLGSGEDDEEEAEGPVAEEDEVFFALCSTLPPKVGEVYLTYGESFRKGYIALNRGDFDTAVERLAAAMEEDGAPESFIPLELATARLHRGEADAAQRLLEPFVARHPEALPAYSLLCGIYWEKKAFDRAHALLDAIPEDLQASSAAVLLRGQTRVLAGELQAARSDYLAHIQTYGWNDPVASALAGVHEALEETAPARDLYAELMARCTGCGARVDPEVKHRYAELLFRTGHTGSDLVELYLSLAREAPQQADLYFQRLSRVYAAQGNTVEAERFRVFAIRAAAEKAGAESPQTELNRIE